PIRQFEFLPTETDRKDEHLLRIAAANQFTRFVFAMPACEIIGRKKWYANRAAGKAAEDLVEPRRAGSDRFSIAIVENVFELLPQSLADARSCFLIRAGVAQKDGLLAQSSATKITLGLLFCDDRFHRRLDHAESGAEFL